MKNAKIQFAGRRTRSGIELPTQSCALLELLREKDFKSIEEARRMSGLSSPQFAATVRLLEKKELVEANAEVRSGRGTRSRTLRIRGGRGYVAAVDIGGTNLRLVIADMTGAIVGKWSGSTGGASSPERVVRLIQKGVENILRRTGLRRDALLAIAAGAPGVTDSNRGVVLLTSYLGGWKDVPLGSLLEKALGVPTAIENDVRLGAVGERWRGSGRGVADFVFIAIGTGIAAGIYLNGELLHGPDFAAGEIGYLIVPGTPDVGVQQGAPGALESAIGGEGIRAQWQQLAQRLYGEAPHSLTATDIFELALTGDEQARNVLARSARILAHAVYNIAVVLNSSLFILGGGVGMSTLLRDATERVLESYSEPVRPKLRLSSLGPDAQLFGALRLALDAAEKRIGIRA
jgi:predicted NBD/HSP70 family sugar kinase